MEISLREWLIIGGILVIALILFDGWRRIRANRNRLRLDIDKTLSEISDTEHHNPELPNGGARVRTLSVTPTFTAAAEPDRKPVKEPELEVQIPPRPETVAVPEPEFEPEPERPVEPVWAAEPEFDPVELQSSMLDDIGSAVEQPAAPEEKSWVAEQAYTEAEIEVVVETEAPIDETVRFDVEPDLHPELEPEPQLQSEPEFKVHPEYPADPEPEFEPEPEFVPEVPEPTLNVSPVSPSQFEAIEPPLVLETDETVEEESLEWDPALEQAFQLDDEPVRRANPVADAEPTLPSSKPPEPAAQIDLSDLDPLFDDIPAMEFDPPVASAKSPAPAKDAEEPNLYLDLDLEQPIHQIMANKVAANKAAGREVTRRSAEKTRRRPTENPSFTLPLDTQHQDLFAVDESFVEEPFVDEQPDLPAPSVEAPPVAPTAPVKPAASEASRTAASAARKALTDLPDPDEVLVITVVGKDRQTLPGERLRRVVEACGMEYGDMSIFHRFEGEGIPSSLQFSMANAVNPGTFDLSTMGELETPAVSFFMSMREPRDPMTAYECMLATAETVAKNLNGDLLDEDRSVMREQTKEHYRQRIRDFEMQSRRRKLSR